MVEIPLDDSWARDSGPIFVRDGDERAGVQFGFNGWGEKFTPRSTTTRASPRACSSTSARRPRRHPPGPRGRLDHRRRRGHADHDRAVPVRGAPQPAPAREEIEAELRAQLGAERVVWLGLGLVEDHDTDGHVDNICAFVAPGQGRAPDGDRRGRTRTSSTARRTLAGCADAGLEVVELPWLPYVPGEEPAVVVPYTQLLHLQRRADRPHARRGDRRRGAGADRLALPGPRGRRGAGRDAGARRRRGPLHHAAGPRRLSGTSGTARDRRRHRRSASCPAGA